MPPPRGTATFTGEVCSGVYRYTMHDDRIAFESDSYVIIENDRAILIDPLPMKQKDLKRHGPVKAILLTASCHERSAWRYRNALKVPVYAPQGGVDFEETPDRWYKAGDQLPGGLRAIHAPGPTEAHYALYAAREGGVVFCADLLTNAEGKGLAFVPDEYQDEPERTRDSVRQLLDLSFEVLCSNHGVPVTRAAKETMRQALTRDQARST
jgi:glyoxylase-like metal-dependent hydrolase (beta-lactamase superfamily II)